ncbi:cardiolipin synthase [Peribacillus asahii]|uniref:cardiolipin synthase n=1 Tax=Peribacillus asahii TaxID=228899 RepID=UPI00380399B8
MEIARTIAFIIFIILILLWIDYKWGQAQHRKKTKKKTYPLRRSNIKIFNSGPKLFYDLFTEIEHAQKHIHILFYIIKNDQFSQQFISLLKQKAESNVEVRLLVDWIGAHKLSKQIIRELKQSGVQFSYCFKPRLPFFFYTLQRRNHRKITVIDGKIGYVGGLNIAKEYVNQDNKLNPWRDYHIKIKGEAVQDLQSTFLTDWYMATKEDLRIHPHYFPPLSPGTQKQQLIVTDGSGVEGIFLDLIDQAKEKIVIGTPYFIPSKRLFNKLRQALHKGVALTIIVPKTADHILVKEASYRYFRVLEKEGATILQFHRGFYHAKVMLIDDQISDIGTSNFDKRSLFLNSEINALLFDSISIEQTKKYVEVDITESAPINEKAYKKPNAFHKLKEAIAFCLSPFL